jgi:hypothetical protein
MRRTGKTTRLLKGAPLLLLLLLVTNGCNGCSGCMSKTYYVGNRGVNPALWMAEACKVDTDCKKTCPQGNFCLPGGSAGPTHGVCVCYSYVTPSCDTALDCHGRPSECDTVIECKRFPGSDVGSCVCRGCDTDLDCKPNAFCPEGSACLPVSNGGKGWCGCKRFLPDGGR